VVSGKEPNGVDHLGELWALAHGIPVKPFPVTPNAWKMLGKKAGPSRNTSMSLYAQAAIILRVPMSQVSKGSDDLYSKMKLLGKPVYREVQGE